MFIVLAYLCNLRSYLIKKNTAKPPNTLEELASSVYDYKILMFPGFDAHPAFQSMANKERLVVDSNNGTF